MSLLPVFRLFAVIILCVVVSPASAGYYKWTDENGVTHFSDEPPGPDGKPVRPNGTTVIPMRDNIRTQKRVEQINNPQPAAVTVKPASTRTADSKMQWEKQQKLREKKRQKAPAIS